MEEWYSVKAEVNAFFDPDGVSVDGWRLFKAVFDVPWYDACGFTEDEHTVWVSVRNQLIRARSSFDLVNLNKAAFIFAMLLKDCRLGLNRSFAYDGKSPGLDWRQARTAEGALQENLSDRLDELLHLVSMA